jgi:hypothetical protein
MGTPRNPTLSIREVGYKARQMILKEYPGTELVRVVEGYKTEGGWAPVKSNALTAKSLRELRNRGFAILNMILVGKDMMPAHPDFKIIQLQRGY